MLDLMLAIAHHLLVFSLFGIVFAEFFALRPGLGGDALARLRGSISSMGSLPVW